MYFLNFMGNTFRIAALFVFVISAHFRLSAAVSDTISVMVYNLLYYGVNTPFCTSTNNNVDLKDINLRTIINHTQPDIFAVNEMGRGEHNADRILNEVMNYNLVNNPGDDSVYDRATYTNTATSTIVNMLYYKRDLFGIHSESVIANEVRDINLYTLYYKNDNLIQGDTTFLHCIVAHLMAGRSNSDQQRRFSEIQAAMGYITQNQIRGNVLFMGDLNMKSSYEQAYGLLTYHPNEDIRFYDPIDMPGEWIDNPEMAPYHTQSTRKVNVGCFASGGMDDRFDQILVSRPVLDGTSGVQYVQGSYRTLGQDGKRLNESLIDPVNYSEPEHVIMALYHTSDHLPVLLDLALKGTPVFVYQKMLQPVIRIVNPIIDTLDVELLTGAGTYTIRIISLFGSEVFTTAVECIASGDSFSFDISFLPNGIYVLQVSYGNAIVATEKLVVY